MLTVQTEEAVDDLRLTLAQRQQGKLNGVLNGFAVHTLVGHGRVTVHQHREQTHIRAASQRGIHREGTPVLPFLLGSVAGHPVHSVLLLDGLLNGTANVRSSIDDKSRAPRSIKLGGSRHQAHVAFTDQVVQLQSLPTVGRGHLHHKAQVGFHQLANSPLVALLDTFREFTFLRVRK